MGKGRLAVPVISPPSGTLRFAQPTELRMRTKKLATESTDKTINAKRVL